MFGQGASLDVQGSFHASTADYLLLEKLEIEKGVPSIAIGQLGPPQLAKYLYETYFLKQLYESWYATVRRWLPDRGPP